MNNNIYNLDNFIPNDQSHLYNNSEISGTLTSKEVSYSAKGESSIIIAEWLGKAIFAAIVIMAIITASKLK